MSGSKINEYVIVYKVLRCLVLMRGMHLAKYNASGLCALAQGWVKCASCEEFAMASDVQGEWHEQS